MQIEISNEAVAMRTAIAAGFQTVEEFVNNLVKREADLLALKEGIADADAGNTRSFDEFDKEFRRRNDFKLDSSD